MWKCWCVVFLYPLLLLIEYYAQDSSKEVVLHRKHVIRVNVIGIALLGNGFLILGYERLRGSHKSFSVNIDEESKSDVLGATSRLIIRKFPGISKALNNLEIDKHGSINIWNFGYRHIIDVGFLFSIQ